MSFQEFPKWKYHPSKEAVIVGNKDAEEALGEGWFNSPADFGVETCPSASGPDPYIASKKIEEIIDQPKKSKRAKA
jgi:hypothetical protein